MTKKSFFLAAMLGILSFYGCSEDAKDNTNDHDNNTCIKSEDCETGICLISGKCAVYVDAGAACGDEKLCQTGYACKNAVCEELPKIECQESTECDSGVCLVEGFCASIVGRGEACDEARLCSKGDTCTDGVCVRGGSQDGACTKNSDCTDGKECQSGKCVDPAPEDGCKKDSDCTDGKECQSGKCVTPSGDFTGIASYSPSDLAKAASSCKHADTCMSNPDCTKGANYAACECAQGGLSCQTYPVCKGIGDCDYTCEGDNCAWLACANSEACVGQCNPTTLLEDEDFDGDGISNGVEITSLMGLDPCNKDTDQDGVSDGDEDLNHNGLFEPELGETNPADSASKRDPNSQEGILIVTACKRDTILAGGSTGIYERFHLAKITNKDYKYYPEADFAKTDVVRFEAPTEKVVGFFGSNKDIIGTGQQMLGNTALEAGTYVETSAFKASVPLASWLIDGKGYDLKLQRVPNHSVDRYKYAITLGDKSLQDVAEVIAKSFDANSTEKYSDNYKCADGKATLYLARSAYDSGRVYSGGIVCDSSIKMGENSSMDDPLKNATLALMDDIISGTLVTPVSIDGYAAFEDFVCQIEPYGKSSGKADFLWVVDNSGSMADELTNLANTIALFAATMKNYGIDFRAGVTTTDAYLLDEDPTAYKAYDDNFNIVLDSNVYLNGVGFRQMDNLKDFRGFIDILTNNKVQGGKQNAFKNEVMKNTKCNFAGKNQNNICGFGFEDGLKSGAFTLSRVAVDVNAADAPAYYSDYDKSIWANIKSIKQSVASDADAAKQADKTKQVNLGTDENTLLYIIWVSDEESRQFKEDPQVVKPVDSSLVNSVFKNSTGMLCRTGYKLNGETMKTGPGGASLDVSECNPSMKSKLNELIESGVISEDSTMEEIEAAYPEYANMLKYYIKQYQNYAQDREIVGFAFVGDIGRNKGGFCQELATCTGKDDSGVERKCEEFASDGKTCLKCNSWNYNDSAATVGANYGLSYIHMARFLSSYYPANPDKETKEGGKASICATDYNATVTAIAEDVVGRLGAHPLNGYPISSTIRVYRVKNNQATELIRNAATDGWAYDASQNAITFKNVQKIAVTDQIAITYVIWRPTEG